MKKLEINNPKTPMSQEWKSCSRFWSRSSPADCGEDHGRAGSPLAIVADIHATAHGRLHTTASGYGMKEAASHGESIQEHAPGWGCSPQREACDGAEGLRELLPLRFHAGGWALWYRPILE